MRAVILLMAVGFAVIAGLFAGKYTVIRTETEILAARTDCFGFSRAYVDVRGWTRADYVADPQTTQTLIDRGYEHLRQREAPPPPMIDLEVRPAQPTTPAEEPVEAVGRRLDQIFKRTDQ